MSNNNQNKKYAAEVFNAKRKEKKQQKIKEYYSIKNRFLRLMENFF